MILLHLQPTRISVVPYRPKKKESWLTRRCHSSVLTHISPALQNQQSDHSTVGLSGEFCDACLMCVSAPTMRAHSTMLNKGASVPTCRGICERDFIFPDGPRLNSWRHFSFPFLMKFIKHLLYSAFISKTRQNISENHQTMKDRFYLKFIRLISNYDTLKKKKKRLSRS